MNQSKTVACLAGDGVGPELMAAATRALDRVAHQRLQVDDLLGCDAPIFQKSLAIEHRPFA